MIPTLVQYINKDYIDFLLVDTKIKAVHYKINRVESLGLDSILPI